MSIMKIEEIAKHLKDRKLSVIVKATGLSRMTLYNIANCKKPKDSYNQRTLIKLTNYFNSQKA